MADILIKIGASSRQFTEELDRIKAKTENLENQLSKVAAISAAAFAALTAEVGFAVKAYAAQEAATNKLNQALQNQGIYSKDLVKAYRAQASEIQNLTGLDDDAIVSGQALIQGYIGQIEVTKELSQAVADFAVAQGIDLESAFTLVGKSIGSSTNALTRYGVEIDANASKQEKLSAVVSGLTARFGGQAEAANKGLGGIQGLKNAFGDLQEQIGERFAPIITTAIQKLTAFIQEIQKNKPLLDFTASMIAAGIAVSGTVGVAAAGGIAFLKLKAALEAARIATSAMSLAVKGLVGATGLGLLVLIIAEIYLNWNTVWPAMQAVFNAFAKDTKEVLMGLGNILLGVFNPLTNFSKIKEGYDQLKALFSKEYKEITGIVQDSGEKQKEAEKKAADERAALEAQQDQYKLQRRKASNELLKLEDEGASKARIDLKQKEIETLSALIESSNNKEIDLLKNRLIAVRGQQSAALAAEQAHYEILRLERENASSELIDLQSREAEILNSLVTERNANEISTLRFHLEQVRTLKAEQHALDKEQSLLFQEEILAQNAEFQALSAEQQEIFRLQNQQQLQGQIETETTTRRKSAVDKAKQQIDSNNQYLVEQQKYGAAFATINQFMQRDEIEGLQQASGVLVGLQKSKYKELKAIGQAAAIAQITINTYQSASDAFKGTLAFFSFLGPFAYAPAAAAAAAAIAFGAEQVQGVVTAASGGIMTGGIPGKDSIPTLTMPGELIVPTRNYEEVVNAVAASRAAQESFGESSPGTPSPSGPAAEVILTLKDDLMDFIETKLVERRGLSISVQGA